MSRSVSARSRPETSEPMTRSSWSTYRCSKTDAGGEQHHAQRASSRSPNRPQLGGQLPGAGPRRAQRRRRSAGPGTAGRSAAPVRPGGPPASPPVPELGGHPLLVELALPRGEVTELDLQRRQAPRPAAAAQAYSAASSSHQDRHRPRVRGGVVGGEQGEVRRPRPQAQQRHPQPLGSLRIERAASPRRFQRRQHLLALFLGVRWVRSTTGVGTGVTGCTTCTGVAVRRTPLWTGGSRAARRSR